MADLTPTAVSKSSNFVTGSGGDTTADICSDLLDNRTEIYSLLTTIRKQQYGATPPSNPNTGDLWRCSTTAGLYVANTTYRWDGSAWVAEIATSINTTARNVVIQGAVTTAGATALFTGSTAALTVQLNATATPMVVTWMDGNDGTSGKVDIVGTVTADSTTFWSSLPQSSTVYLYVDFDGTSTISGGFSTVAPVYQNYAPSVTATGTHWIDDNLGLVKSSDGANWTQRYRVFVGTATTDTTKVTSVSIYPYNVLRTNITGTASGNEPALGNPASDGYVLSSTASGARSWIASSSTGSESQQFSVADATTAHHAVALGQFSGSFSTSGYRKLPDGTIIQWGSASVTNGSGTAISFPITFPNAVYSLVTSLFYDAATNFYAILIRSISTSGTTLYNNNGTHTVYWMAIGR